MDTDKRFTDGRVADSGIRAIMSDEHRWQRWLDVEAALAEAEAELGIIPVSAAQAIRQHAHLDLLSAERVRAGIMKTSHPFMALISELSEATGSEYGGWVHWGATTQNITQTGDALVLREAHEAFLGTLGQLFEKLEHLAIEGRAMVCAGRTHGQHAVPITFGFKVATWIDEFERHVERLRQVEPRAFVAIMGGAVGNFASFGDKGPLVQAKVAEALGLGEMAVPSRAISDPPAEYVCILGMMAASGAQIAKEIVHLMQPEFGEVCEPAPDSTIGSSTMPHKRNPQLTEDCIALAAQIRALVPLALESIEQEQEVSYAHTSMTDKAVMRAGILSGDLLVRLVVILDGLKLDPRRMRQNLELSGGFLNSEAVMLALAEFTGRQQAHEIVQEAARTATVSRTEFGAVLAADPRVNRYLAKAALRRLLRPEANIGLSTEISDEAARRAHKLAQVLSPARAMAVSPGGR